MALSTDFVIENGVLVKYTGTDAAVTIPDGVTEIGARAFCDCASLTSVTISEGVTHIGRQAFARCIRLTAVHLPATLVEMEYGAFSSCTSLTEAVIPEGIQTLASSTFHNCENLISVTLPQSVFIIDNVAFENCTRLEQVILPDRKLHINNHVFRNCPALCRMVTHNKKVFDVVWKQLTQAQRRNVILTAVSDRTADPTLITKIKANRDFLLAEAAKEDAVETVTYLFSLYKEIPLEKLDEYLGWVQGAPQITAFILRYKNERYSPAYQERQEERQIEKEFGLRKRSLTEWQRLYMLVKRESGYALLSSRGKEEHVTVPDEIGGTPVTAIGSMAFSPHAYGSSTQSAAARRTLRSITIPDSVTRIGNDAFRGCINLTAVHGLGCVTAIDDHLFTDCQKLQEVTIPATVTEIGIRAFAGCTALTHLTIPAGVTAIANDAFYGCKNLILHVSPDSFAHQFAQKRRIPFVEE